jgi:hypothetical protein
MSGNSIMKIVCRGRDKMIKRIRLSLLISAMLISVTLICTAQSIETPAGYIPSIGNGIQPAIDSEGSELPSSIGVGTGTPSKGNLDLFFIHIHNAGGGPAGKASVVIDQKGRPKINGISADNGIYRVWLEGGIITTITASLGNQKGSWYGIIDRSKGNKIIVRMVKGPIIRSIFEDDFSRDKGWTSSPPMDIVRDTHESNVHWHVDRSYDQRMYHIIDPVRDDYKISVDALINDATNNCDVKVGLLNDVENAEDSSGLLLQIGYYGGGTPYQHWYACVVGKYSDGTTFTSTTGKVEPSGDTWGGYVTISPNKWYTYELVKQNSNWKLIVYDVQGRSVGSISGRLMNSISSPRYVYIGNWDTNDWPTADGKLDNIKINTL